MRKSRTMAFSSGVVIQYIRDEIVWFVLSQQWGFSVILQDRQLSRDWSFSPWEPTLSISFRALFNSFLKVIHLDKRLQSCDFTEKLSEIVSLFLRGPFFEIFHRFHRWYINVRVCLHWYLSLLSL